MARWSIRNCHEPLVSRLCDIGRVLPTTRRAVSKELRQLRSRPLHGTSAALDRWIWNSRRLVADEISGLLLRVWLAHYRNVNGIAFRSVALASPIRAMGNPARNPPHQALRAWLLRARCAPSVRNVPAINLGKRASTHVLFVPHAVAPTTVTGTSKTRKAR